MQLEAAVEMRQVVEAYGKGDLRNGGRIFQDQLAGAFQPKGQDEIAGVLAGQRLDPAIQVRFAETHLASESVDAETGIMYT